MKKIKGWQAVLFILFLPISLPALFIYYFIKAINGVKTSTDNKPDFSSMNLFGKSSQIKEENEMLKNEITRMRQEFEAVGYTEYEQFKKASDEINATIAENNKIIDEQKQTIDSLASKIEQESKQLKTVANKLNKSKELYQSVDYAIANFFEYTPDLSKCKLSEEHKINLDELSPSVILKLHYMDVKDLRKAYRENEKLIEKLLMQYASRYTTKTNKVIYALMVIALRAELQNILYNLKYEKLDTAIEQVKSMTAKYLAIASDGNQSIVGTITKFVGEIEYLFINAVKIEYNYYVKKEQARQEQLAIKEQMRQEAEERKALEAEKKKVEAEESKYEGQISALKSQLGNASDDEANILKARILELERQLSEVVIKKSDIIKLQNGKAGNIYIISNLGSFGENVFKIGMTRRLDPQERVNELGSASVPFKFDVHSFIFSDDAVELENKLHEKLHKQRVNKVNLRKEFFYSSVDELEAIVNEIDPTAEFNKTMLAEDFRQSLSSDEVYSNEYSLSDDKFNEDED